MTRQTLLLVTACLAAPCIRAADRPNLLVIETDEHNFRTLGCYRALLPKDQAQMWGPAVVETPHIDWLAQEGAICTRFYATTPVCSPSRAAFVSGLYPHNTPVNTNNIPLRGDVVTFAEILRRNGYATGYAGKWHLNGSGKPQWAPSRKFGFADNRFMFNRGHWKQFELVAAGPRIKARNAQGRPTYDVDGADVKSFSTDWLADRTVDFIKQHKSEAWCYMLSLPDPHGPNTVRAPYDTMFADKKFTAPKTMSKPAANLPSWGRKVVTKLNGAGIARYYGMVRCIDDNVGKILKALRATGTLKNTIIVFTSDHGDLMGEHGRQNKGVPYDGSARVAFVLYAPGRVKPGTVVRQALTCVDFLPTIIPMMGFKTTGAEEGRDARALFTGAPPADWKDIAFMRGTGGPERGWVAALSNRYKLVYSTADEPWLFDLEKDPDELTNFFQHPNHREIVRQMSRELAAYGKKYKDGRVAHPRIRADLKWAVEGTGAYAPPDVPAQTTPAGKGRKGGRKGRKKDRKQANLRTRKPVRIGS